MSKQLLPQRTRPLLSNGPRSHLGSIVRLPILTLLLALTAGNAHADRNTERALHREALADLYAVRLASFEQKLARLEDYPLVPYLHYARLMRYISTAEPADIVAFRERWSDTPLADQALTQWLDNLARRGQWKLYREHFDPTIATSATLQCRYYRALYETGAREEGLTGAARMWLFPNSRPDVCDPLFAAWRAAGRLDDDIAWQRISLAIGANRPSLASYLVRYLNSSNQRLAQEFIALHRQPERLTRMASLPGTAERAAQVVGHSLRRLARTDAAAAERAWETWATRVTLSADEQAAIREEILRWRIRRNRAPDDLHEHWPPAELVGRDTRALVEEITRRAIAEERWPEVLTWISHLPDEARNDTPWQYWRARASLELITEPSAPGLIPVTATGADPARPLYPFEAYALLAEVASRRNYYGFMAADRLGTPVNLQNETLEFADGEVAAMANRSAVRRAFELYATGELADARRELAWLRQRLDTRELLILAEVAREAGWHGQSIQATIAAREWNHIDLRFPLAFAEPMLANASQRRIEPSWLFAVARQESAFMTDARSSAGALGVMQVMPATARMTARQQEIPLANTWQLLDYNKNIEIGSSYLSQMYERYDRNRILASAAYNAGPGRVDQWLRNRRPTPADVWIESIPFHETRGYVQNVLAYSLIYSRRLDAERPFLQDHER